VTHGIGIDEHNCEGRVITAEFLSFYVVNCYVPNRLSPDYAVPHASPDAARAKGC
jgi:exonuclease III